MLKEKLIALKRWWTEKIRLINLFTSFPDKRNTVVCLMGDIYMAHLGINIGNEIEKLRPVLIFQGHDIFIQHSGLVIVLPITSNVKNVKYRVNFSQNDLTNGHIEPGSIVIQQIRSISKFRLGKKLGEFKVSKLREVHTVLLEYLQKNTPLRSKPEGDME